MEHPLLKKLQIKPGSRLFLSGVPEDMEALLTAGPEDSSSSARTPESAQAMILFVQDSRALHALLPAIVPYVQPETVCWIAYPKKSSGVPSDLYLMGPWKELDHFGLRIVSSAGINSTWSGVRVRAVGAAKASGMALADIARNAYGAFINVTDRTVTLPADMQEAIAADAASLRFFNSLSFSNRKEYVLWVLSARQEKTRKDRIAKTVVKLADGKKNPSDK